tara:strand:+ start:486 stop:716 length:231 start_codon:yes stop_codon:yes gene_type:complete
MSKTQLENIKPKLMFKKALYEMSESEMRDCIFHLRREVQFQIDCKELKSDMIEHAKSQGFFDGFEYHCGREAWIRK